MIPFDFEYYRPDTVQEAIQIFHTIESLGKKVIYYGGGTEIISMARTNNLHTDAVIDLKAIPECSLIEIRGDELVIGSAVNLTRIAEANAFPLLGRTVARIADHTVQGQITLGGNLAGKIIYREAVLPLLLADSQVVIEDGHKQLPLKEVFNQELRLTNGEFISQIIINKRYCSCPFYHIKKTRIDKIDYPLLTAAALKGEEGIRIAFSGLYPFPFRSIQLESYMNTNGYPLQERINNVISRMPAPLLDDIRGSSAYRKLILKNVLTDAWRQLEGVP